MKKTFFTPETLFKLKHESNTRELIAKFGDRIPADVIIDTYNYVCCTHYDRARVKTFVPHSVIRQVKKILKEITA